MKRYLFLMMFISVNALGYGENIYLEVYGGSTQFETQNIEGDVEAFTGVETGGMLGGRLNQWLSLEVGFSIVKFSQWEDSTEYASDDEVIITMQRSLSNLQYGARFHLGPYFTIKAGAITSQANFNIEAEGTGTEANAVATIYNELEDQYSGSGTYLGMGVNYNLGRYNFFADLTYRGIKFSNDDDYGGNDSHIQRGIEIGLRMSLN